jgi:hypothetical protein
MEYKYVIRKVKSKFVPLVKTNGYWRYLIRKEDRFMASQKNYMVYDNIIDAYKFVATHRMEKGQKGKDRPRCMYYKEGLGFIPLLGIGYILKGLFSGVPYRYLFSSPLSMGFSMGIQITILLVLLILVV